MVRPIQMGMTLSILLGLLGCGALPSVTTRPFEVGSGLYRAKGEARLIIKRRAGMRVESLEGLDSVRPLRTVDGLNVQVAAISMDKLDHALGVLRADPRVAYAEPAYRVGALTQPAPPSLGFRLVPDDPYFLEQYALERMHAPEAWMHSRGDGVTVAMIDTGVDVAHPEFQGKLVSGYNALDHSGNVWDDNGHGTHCAGIAAAWANNGRGVAGVAPNCRLMPIKALDADGAGSDVDVADGIAWAVGHGANVISMSLGGPNKSQVLMEAVAYAERHGVSVVAAMGNDGSASPCYPAAYPGVIAVGASDETDQVAPFSQAGAWTSVVAPGVQVLSTLPRYACTLGSEGYAPNYGRLDGTSMAVPAVAGVVALVQARYGTHLAPDAIKRHLEASSDPTWGQHGFDPHAGYGRVNAARAVE